MQQNFSHKFLHISKGKPIPSVVEECLQQWGGQVGSKSKEHLIEEVTKSPIIIAPVSEVVKILKEVEVTAELEDEEARVKESSQS